jgi:hypothetical protein
MTIKTLAGPPISAYEHGKLIRRGFELLVVGGANPHGGGITSPCSRFSYLRFSCSSGTEKASSKNEACGGVQAK